MGEKVPDGSEQREIAELLLDAAENIDEAADRIEATDRDYGMTREFLADHWREKGEYFEEAASLMQKFAGDMDGAQEDPD